MIKRKSALIILVLIILSTFILIAIPSCSYASDPISNPGYFKPDSTTDVGGQKIKSMAGVIIGVLKSIGIIASVITLMIIGIKYMLGSLEEKAEYKKTMIPYLVGAVMVFSIPQILDIIYKSVTDVLK